MTFPEDPRGNRSGGGTLAAQGGAGQPDGPCFPYLLWVRKVLRLTRTGEAPWTGGEGSRRLPGEKWPAVLLMGYMGGFSLGDLADLAGIGPRVLLTWRTSPIFLQLLDHSKAAYAREFPEYLFAGRFSWRDYQDMAGEFVFLEDSLKVRVRTRLWPQLQDLARALAQAPFPAISGKGEAAGRFGRLFRFFWALEAFSPSPARPFLEAQWVSVLPRTRDPELRGLPAQPWEERGLGERLRKILAQEIRRVFFPLLAEIRRDNSDAL